MKKLCGEQFVRFFSATVNFGITDTAESFLWKYELYLSY